MSKSNYAENKVLDWCVGRPAATITPYLALFTAAPGETGGGTEVTGGAYARKATTGTDWAASANGSVSNTAIIDFATATGNYPAQVTHFGIFDALSGGNLIRYAALSTPRTITLGDVPRFAAGSLTFTED